MFAQINLPGSSHFRKFGPDTRENCQDWLDQTVSDMLETELLTSTLPRLIISNKEAKKVKYRDGRHVFGEYGHWMY